MGEPSPFSDEEILKLCQEPHPVTHDFRIHHVLYRIKDPRKSVPFYNGVLGMRLLAKWDPPNIKMTIFFLGYAEPTRDFEDGLNSIDRMQWLARQKGVLGLSYQWGSEDDPNYKGYHSGNSEPLGYGYISLAVPDCNKVCERFESLGVNFILPLKENQISKFAIIQDPDGYWVEIFSNKHN